MLNPTMPKQTTILTTMFVLLTTQATYAGPPSFTGLGFLPEGRLVPESKALGISADGSTVVGWSTSNSQPNATIEAFRWTSDTGMVGLGHLDAPNALIYLSEASSVSADGSTAVGYSISPLSPPNIEAVRWTTGTGIESLHISGPQDSFANAISDNGSTIVGYRDSVDIEAFRWTAETGAAYLGDLPGGEFESTPYDVSADGSVIVGVGSSEFGPEAFRWTHEEGMVGLGYLPGGSFSYAYGVSADGSTIVGRSYTDLGYEAFRWTADGGMVGLSDLLGTPYHFNVANDVSADGSVIVGRGYSLFGNEAILWDDANGSRSLKEVLTTDFGLDLAGWQLTEANAVSADGRTIVGNGINPDGFEEGWIAVVPEPSTFTLAGCGLAALLLSAWRRRRAVCSPSLTRKCTRRSKT